jgi:Na+-transporting NADH:ubiquinone oxidoreductase subunit NqrF
MKFHSVVTTLAMAASICVPTAMHAAPTASVHAPVHAFFGKVHMVTLNLRNDTKENMTVKAGDKELTLLPGKPQTVKLAAGEKIIATAQCAGHTDGEVLSTVDPVMDQGTLGLK